ncbi:TcpQ domain-containing protein [Variovorax sp. J22P271]|uniref:TcpQ domain-containing protein n=1 Tax=Variovorax davisae TaxID=3053515 RepID=UPI0025768691|nr:TcpQ domain-containing protein [Variovorax sp. J22P271]MDM0036748.1 TcpQ domain-containing protein [Variovorax sp. J22P271]
MLKTAPLYAAVLALCACTSAPTVKFPSGSSTRVAINAPMKPIAAAVAPIQTSPASAGSAAPLTAAKATAQATGKKPVVAAIEHPPEPLQLRVYLVNGNERSMMTVLRRWARTARVDFTWESEVDYPITSRMRAIDATDLEGALEQMRAALDGVRLPLVISMTADGVVVQNGELPVAVEAPPVEVPAAPAAVTQTPSPEKAPTAWAVDNGKTLQEILAKWTALAGIKLVWESKAEHPSSDAVRGATYSGSFREALGHLAGQYGEFKTPLGMKFLDNGTALRVYDMADAP